MERMKISEQARTIRNRYQRQWRRKNADKLRNYNVVYWEKKAQDAPEQVAEQSVLFR
jgi:hypothetical protein